MCARQTLQPDSVIDGNGLWASKIVNGTTTTETWDVAEGLTIMFQDGATEYYYEDHVGRMHVLASSTSETVSSFSYDSYDILVAQKGTTTSFGYAGQYTDGESEYQYLRARYYDPATSQFLTVDPLVDQTGQPYGYGNSNPLNTVDPLGLGCGVGPIPLPCPSDVGTFGSQVFASATGLTPAYAPPAKNTSTFFRHAPTTYGTPTSDIVATGLLFLIPGGGEDEAAARLGILDDWEARLPVGRSDCPLDVSRGTDAAGEAGGRLYSGHAFDRLQGRGFTPSVINNVIENGELVGTEGGSTIYYDAENHISVAVGREGRGVTASYGRFRLKP